MVELAKRAQKQTIFKDQVVQHRMEIYYLMNNNQSTHQIDQISLQNLRVQLEGNAYVPGDEGYSEACLTWHGPIFEQKPAIVIQPAMTADVLVAINFAREHALPIGVQGGKGHGRTHPVDGALLINFALMKKIHVDGPAAVARVEPGVKWMDIIPLAHEYGLAPLNGISATVGVTGYLLGGGFGWLSRQYGIGASSVRSLEVVTLDGRILEVNEQNYSELFWGLRGGGGNFCIVTAIEFALYPVKEVFGGQVMYPIEQAKTVINAYMQWIKTIPTTLTSIFRIMHFPPLPGMPDMLSDKTFVIVAGCYNGTKEEGEVIFQSLRALGTPVFDTFAQIPYSQVASISNDPAEGPPVHFYVANKMLRDFTPDDVDAFLQVASDPNSGLFQMEMRHLGGVVADLPEDAMAASARDVNFCLYIMAAAPTAEQLEAGKQSIAKLMPSLRSAASVSTWINGLGFNDIDVERTRAAYTPESYQRLIALKRVYDPQNLLRFNQNILP
jgi:hypothetical protein